MMNALIVVAIVLAVYLLARFWIFRNWFAKRKTESQYEKHMSEILATEEGKRVADEIRLAELELERTKKQRLTEQEMIDLISLRKTHLELKQSLLKSLKNEGPTAGATDSKSEASPSEGNGWRIFWSVVISLFSLGTIVVLAGLSFADQWKSFVTYPLIISVIVATIIIVRELNSSKNSKAAKSVKNHSAPTAKTNQAEKKIQWNFSFFWHRSKKTSAIVDNEDSNPIGKYHEGAGNAGLWIVILAIALVISVIIFLAGNQIGWFKHTGWEWYSTYSASIGIILGIVAVWAAVVALIASGFTEIDEGYVGLVTVFKKYAGTVSPGLFFTIALINEYFKVYLGQQWLQLNLTDEKDVGSGAIDSVDGTPIDVKAKVKFVIVKERAHLAIFNAISFTEFIVMKMDSLIRSFLSCYSFNEVNTLTGNKAMVAIFSQNYLKEDGTPKKFSEINFGKLEESDVQKALQASSSWQAILRDWGIKILDLNIENYDLPENMKKAREQLYTAENEFLKTVTEVKTAEQQKLKRIQAAQARNAELDEDGKGFAKQITAAMEASGATGERVLAHVEKRLKYSAIEKGANAILSDDSGSRFVQEGVGFGAGEEMWLNRNQKNNPTKDNQTQKGVPNVETQKDVRRPGGKKAGEDKIGK